MAVAQRAGPHSDSGFGLLHGPAVLVFEPVVEPAGRGQVTQRSVLGALLRRRYPGEESR